MPLLDSGAALYAGGADEFVVMAPASRLTAHLTREFARRYGTVNESEARSWRNSLTALAAVVEGAGLHRAGVGVELRLPSTSRRVDASFVGRDARGQPQVVLCELKQWETAAPSAAPDNVLVGGRETLHPSVQAAAYADYLRQSHSAFTERGFGIAACAYLHNMDAADARSLRGLAYAGATREAPFYVRGDEAALGAALAGAVGGGDGAALLPELVAGRFSPSKQLLDGIAAGLKGSAFWTLLDEQRAAYNVVRGLVERAAQTGEKAVVVITGGPGTGKSVIAAHLVLALSKNGAYRAAHSTASKAFTTNLRAVGGRSSEAVFRWNKDFGHKLVDADVLDVLVVDEAHRVRKSSNTQYTPKRVRSEIPQADELIRAARVSVFLLDERQNVRPDEIGNVAAIEEAAVRQGVPLRRFGLDAQFRCNGSSAYVAWVDALMSDAPVPVGGWATRGGDETAPNEPQAAEAPRASGTASSGVQAPQRSGGRVRHPPGRVAGGARGARAGAGGGGAVGAARGGLLLAVVGPGAGRHARARRADRHAGRRMGDAVEREVARAVRGEEGERTAAGSAPVHDLGNASRGHRAGRLHLLGAGVRVRLLRRDPRAGPGVARGRGLAGEQGRVVRPVDQPAAPHARPARGHPAAHLPRAAHARDAGHGRILDRHRDAGVPAGAPHGLTARCAGLRADGPAGLGMPHSLWPIPMLNADEQVATTQRAVEAFCREFVKYPYLCYTEHGIHARFLLQLYTELPEHGRYAEWDGNRVCVVQKEYPTAASLGKPRRQHWDVAVLRTPLECPGDRLTTTPIVRLPPARDGGRVRAELRRRSPRRGRARLCHRASNVDDPVIVHLYRFSTGRSHVRPRHLAPGRPAFVRSPPSPSSRPSTRLDVYYGVADSTETYPSGLWRITAGDAAIDVTPGAIWEDLRAPVACSAAPRLRLTLLTVTWLRSIGATSFSGTSRSHRAIIDPTPIRSAPVCRR